MSLPAVKAILIDIEGTVCSISFVKDILFPYALDATRSFLVQNWSEPWFQPYLLAFPEPSRDTPENLEEFIRYATSADLKIPSLKGFQGLLWKDGYTSGAIKAPIYDDVLPALRRWRDEGKKVLVYSSGSVPAQKLLFQHTDTEMADMTPLFDGYYDTVNAGLKQKATSYRKIIEQEGIDADGWLFLSDNVGEVEAAKEAGMDAIVLVRPGNSPLDQDVGKKHTVVETFSAISV
ncbi:acireductone synthase-like protein [Tricharina praecox]|uniref:acireductone synthase-like protein n=1 Tax=Tricharina praecox TaxID=43433 RepID=UPI00221FE6BF|nr:acireductone synthase-like protein [Tricharina praecox]KAI5854054.1 acireductone synthase-like protein [Tricharina praecox]